MSLLSVLPATRPPSKRDSASYPVCQHHQSRLRTGSSIHMGVPCICSRIPIPRCISTGSSTHLSVALLRCLCLVYWHNLPVYSPRWSLLPPRLPDSSRLCYRASSKIPFSEIMVSDIVIGKFINGRKESCTWGLERIGKAIRAAYHGWCCCNEMETIADDTVYIWVWEQPPSWVCWRQWSWCQTLSIKQSATRLITKLWWQYQVNH